MHWLTALTLCLTIPRAAPLIRCLHCHGPNFRDHHTGLPCEDTTAMHKDHRAIEACDAAQGFCMVNATYTDDNTTTNFPATVVRGCAASGQWRYCDSYADGRLMDQHPIFYNGTRVKTVVCACAVDCCNAWHMPELQRIWGKRYPELPGFSECPQTGTYGPSKNPVDYTAPPDEGGDEEENSAVLLLPFRWSLVVLWSCALFCISFWYHC